MSKLSELDILRLSDAKVNDKGETIYYSRAEDSYDVLDFSWVTGHQFPIDLWEEMEFPYEITIRFATKLSYSEILGYMSLLRNKDQLMRYLDVIPNSHRFWDVVFKDYPITRAKLPRNHKKLDRLASEYSYGGNALQLYIGAVSSGFICVMNGKDIRDRFDSLDKKISPEYEPFLPLENIEPIP